MLAFVFLQVLMVFFSCGQSTFISVYFPAYIVSIYWERSLKVAKTLHKDHVREGKRVNTGRMPFSSSFVNGAVGEKSPLGNERLGEKAELFLNGEGERARFGQQLRRRKPSAQDAGWRRGCPLVSGFARAKSGSAAEQELKPRSTARVPVSSQSRGARVPGGHQPRPWLATSSVLRAEMRAGSLALLTFGLFFFFLLHFRG